MVKKVLVAYATKHGATAEIADKIGDILRKGNIPTDVLPVWEVEDLQAYTAVILGSAVYMGQWRKKAVKFLQTYKYELAQRDVWLFSSGPTGEGDPIELLDGWRFPEKQQPLINHIQPHDIAIFHGVLDLNQTNFLEKWIINRIDAPVGDFRDWEEIAEWATAVVHTLKQPA